MKYLIILMLPLSLILMVGCEDEAEAFDCESEIASMETNAFQTQLAEYMAAAFAGDTEYVQPSDWGTNCNSYKAGMQKLFDEGCFTAEDSVTQETIDGFSAFCDLVIP